MLVRVPPQALDLIPHGQDSSAAARSREPDCRRRSRRAAGIRHQGAGRELDRCRRASHLDRRRARRQEADSGRGRRRGDDAGGCATGDRASCDEQDQPRRRSRADRDARFSRRGAAEHRVGLALHAEDAARAAPLSGTEVRVNGGAVASVTEVGMPEGTAIDVADVFYNLPARRKFLKSDAAESAQVSRIVTQLALCYPEIGFTLTSSGTEGAAVSAGRQPARSPVSALRRAQRPDRRAPRQRRREDPRLRGGAGGAGADARTAERLRQSPHRQGPDHRARDHRCLQRRVDQGAQSRGASVHRDAARRRRRERAPDEGGGALSRPVLHPRADSPDARRRARPRPGPGAAARGAGRIPADGVDAAVAACVSVDVSESLDAGATAQSRRVRRRFDTGDSRTDGEPASHRPTTVELAPAERAERRPSVR